MNLQTAPPPSEAANHDREYQDWLEQQGSKPLDLDWRLKHLPWPMHLLLRRYPPEGRRVLDFRCRDGVFTLRLQRLGAKAVGYDNSPRAIAQAERFRGSAPHPTFTTVPPGPGQFDLVYCNGVPELEGDGSAFVGELAEFLTPGGALVGTMQARPLSQDSSAKTVHDHQSLERALTPWGTVRIRHCNRTPLRNLLPFRQAGAAVFIFEVRPQSLRDAR